MGAAAAVVHKLVLLAEGTLVGETAFSLLALAGAAKLALERSLSTYFFYARHPQLLQQLVSECPVLRLLLGAPRADAEQHLMILHHHRTGRIHALAAVRAAEQLHGSSFMEYFSRGTDPSFNDLEDDMWTEEDMGKKEAEDELNYTPPVPSYLPEQDSRTASALEGSPSFDRLTAANISAAVEDVQSTAGCASVEETQNFFRKLPPEFAELFHEASYSSDDPLTAHTQGFLSGETEDERFQLIPCRSNKLPSTDQRDEDLQVHDVSGDKLTRFSAVSALPRSPVETSLNELSIGKKNEDICIISQLGGQAPYHDSPTGMKGQFFKQQLQILVDLLLEVQQNEGVSPDDLDRPSVSVGHG